jgi:AcrR family transcriptional regulator
MDTTLHRDDPDKEPLAGNTRVTREDWVNTAHRVLIAHGVEQVKILGLAERMSVSRSSFYWYFKSRQDLLDVLLDEWMSTNTAVVIEPAEAPAPTITAAVCHVLAGFVDPARFNTKLDFAIRDWARRDAKVRAVLVRSDAQRVGALEAMFARFDYPPAEALARARIAYYMQIGYNDADLDEPMSIRLTLLPEYLYAYTGVRPLPEEVERLRAWSKTLAAPN